MNAVDALPVQTASLVRVAKPALWSDTTHAFQSADTRVDIDVDLARRHGMLAWTPRVPIDASRAHAQQALRGIRGLLEAAAALDEAHVPFVAFKGPVLAQWLYGDPCARRFADIDLLVTSERGHEALTVLESLGYRRRIAGAPDGMAHRWIGAWPLSRAGDDVDLHWRLLGPRFGSFLDTATVVDESMTITLAGRALRTPRPEHAAALVIVHSAKHLWYALEYVFALATMTRRASINWEEVHEVMGEAGAINAAATGFALVQALFGVDPPSAFRTAVSRRDVPALRDAALQSLSLPPGVFPDRRLDRRLQRLSLDRRIDRVRYDLLRIFEPTQADCEWIDLPESLAVLYWLVRPLRLAAREWQR